MKISSHPRDVDFPSYQVLLEVGSHSVAVDVASLRAQLEAAPTSVVGGAEGVSFITIRPDGVQVGASENRGGVVVAVNREFLLQALGDGGQLTLGIDDPIAPLAIRDPGRDGVMSVLMPVRPDAQGVTGDPVRPSRSRSTGTRCDERDPM